MSHPFAMGQWSAAAVHLPSMNPVLLGVLLLAGVLGLWFALSTRSTRHRQTRKQWILLREQDSEGIPVLAEHRAWGRSGKPVAHKINPNYRRSDY